MGRSQGEELREGPALPCSSAPCQELRQAAPAASKSQAEDKSPCQAGVKWRADSQPQLSVSLGGCQALLAWPGHGKEPSLVDICSAQAAAEQEAPGQRAVLLPSHPGFCWTCQLCESWEAPPGGTWTPPVTQQLALALNPDPSCWHSATDPAVAVT